MNIEVALDFVTRESPKNLDAVARQPFHRNVVLHHRDTKHLDASLDNITPSAHPFLQNLLCNSCHVLPYRHCRILCRWEINKNKNFF